MPTKRAKVSHAAVTFGNIERDHLITGDCLFGGGCNLCDSIGGPASPLPRLLRMDAARWIWERHRERLLADWNRVQTVDWYHREDNSYGFGQWGIPAFAECVFDGRELPEPDPAWPEVVERHWRMIAGNLDALREYLAAHPEAA